MSATLLEVRGLTKRFGGLTAVDDLGFDVKTGSIKAVIGPNGSGKTTLFNLISGVEPIEEGEVLLAGEAVQAMPPRERARRRMARTFQNLQVFEQMTVLEAVMVGYHTREAVGLAATLLRLPASRRLDARAADAALEALRTVGLTHRAAMLATSLSFGELKLMEIARALAARPRLLLLDEPAAGLPTIEAVRLAGIMGALRDAGMTILLVEHNMRLVMDISDEVMVLNFGRRIAEGTAHAMQNDATVIEAYLGREDDLALEQPA